MSSPAITIDPSDPAPLHEQVAAALRRAIADGEAGPGDRLPPARDLGAVLGVNANTVLRALRPTRDLKISEKRAPRPIAPAKSADPQQEAASGALPRQGSSDRTRFDSGT